MTKHTLTINWPALFNAPPFREGWRHAKAAMHGFQNGLVVVVIMLGLAHCFS